jgi:hypothetical protein
MRVGLPKVRESISSDTVAYAFPYFTKYEQNASASPGAYTTGIPMALTSFLASSTIGRVTLTSL